MVKLLVVKLVSADGFPGQMCLKVKITLYVKKGNDDERKETQVKIQARGLFYMRLLQAVLEWLSGFSPELL